MESSNNQYNISGIQQVGIGVTDVEAAFKWYRKNFGMDIKVFDDENTAKLMTRYTGGEAFSRRALLALNMQGGGGFEIWQFTGRKPTLRDKKPQLGDYGIYIVKMRSNDIVAAEALLKKNGANLLTGILEGPSGLKHLFVEDPFGNIFQVEELKGQFSTTNHPIGGVLGSVICVSDIDKSKSLFSNVLGYDKEIYDQTGTFDDLQEIPGGDQSARRVMLSLNNPAGPFSDFFGYSRVELIEVKENQGGESIFKDRFWGDPGFIHLCYDVQGMQQFKSNAEHNGYPFTVDSSDSFDMGEAAGHFSYVENLDGTLIELVETHKMPMIKKIGWSIDLKKREPGKPLPKWILKLLSMKRVKN